MSISQICIEQHEKESKKLNKFLVYCFAASIVAHIIGIIFLPYLFKEKEFVEADEPIEIIVIDEPEQEKPPTSEPSVKPEETSPVEQSQSVAQITQTPQDTQTTLIEPPEQAIIQPPVVKPEITNSETVAKPKVESPDIQSDIKEDIPKNIEKKLEESPEKPVSEASKPDTPIPTDTIADNTDNSSPVISGESPDDETSPSDENPGYIRNNEGNRTIEKPINSKPIDEGSGNSSENSRIIADGGNTNTGSISNDDIEGSPALSSPGSITRNSGKINPSQNVLQNL
ncbi:hypothetical protein Riv7116_6195 [Rivularia sp. PCC 7116]|uniref:hypothetical protein n=1 Tax=Rivularia sp. PCC 7116 TaxID=373994 RepID=UPI00029EE047|nr:hypothetical protein [Rivularia sp. PCC 7116]AFY58546.1 hypothetical protein Riv7116_6195 [Rivularia sp. PCC 7116]